MTNIKILTPVTSGLNGNNLIFGALANTDPDASLFTINSLSDFISTINLKLGNNTVNVTANSVLLQVSDTTGIANLKPTSLVLGTSIVNTTAHAIGTNVLLTSVKLSIGNNTVNALANSLLLQVSDTTGAANLIPSSLQIQANILLDSVKLSIGNNTVNALANSLLLQVADTTGAANLKPSSLQIQANVSINTTAFGIAGNTSTAPTLVLSSNSTTAILYGNTTVTGAPSITMTNTISNAVLSSISLAFGNNTVNALANSLLLQVSDTTGAANLKPASLFIHANISLNTTAFGISGNNTTAPTLILSSNSTTAVTYGNNSVTGTPSITLANSISNAVYSSISLSFGNNTVNAFANSLIFKVADTTGISNVTPTQVVTGNATVYCNVGVGGIQLTGSNNFSLGSGSRAATAIGYTFLQGGLILQWGWVNANATVGNATFAIAFPTACFMCTCTSNNTTAANAGVAVIATNTTVAQIRSLSAAASSNTFYMAIGN